MNEKKCVKRKIISFKLLRTLSIARSSCRANTRAEWIIICAADVLIAFVVWLTWRKVYKLPLWTAIGRRRRQCNAGEHSEREKRKIFVFRFLTANNGNRSDLSDLVPIKLIQWVVERRMSLKSINVLMAKQEVRDGREEEAHPLARSFGQQVGWRGIRISSIIWERSVTLRVASLLTLFSSFRVLITPDNEDTLNGLCKQQLAE